MSVSQKSVVDGVVHPCPPKPDRSPVSTSQVRTESVSIGSPVISPKPIRLRDEFVVALKVEKMASRTIDAYCNAVQMFADFLHRSPLLNISVNDVRAFFFTLSANATMPLVLSTRFSTD